MIAKIKVEGKEMLAVVLNEVTSLEDLQTYSNSLISLIGCVCSNGTLNGYENEIFGTTRLLEELQPTIDQAITMERAVFGGRFEPKKIEPKPCEIWI